MSRHVNFVENVFTFTSPSTSPTPVIDTASSLPTSYFPSCDYSAPPLTHIIELTRLAPLITNTPPVLPPSCFSSTYTTELIRTAPFITNTPPVLLPTCTPDPAYIISAAFSIYWLVGSCLLGPIPFPPSLSPSPFPTLNLHLMQIRSKNGILKPNPKYDLTTIIPLFTEPCTIAQGLQDPKWV